VKLIAFYITHFHHIQLAIPSHRYFRLALTVAKQIIQSEKKIDKELLKKLEWIEENTTKKLEVPLVKVQLAVIGSNPYKEVELKTNMGTIIEHKPMTYIRELYTAYEEICDIVTKVIKKYSHDIDLEYGFETSGQGGYLETRT